MLPQSKAEKSLGQKNTYKAILTNLPIFYIVYIISVLSCPRERSNSRARFKATSITSASPSRIEQLDDV
jgi:hypothetical protein